MRALRRAALAAAALVALALVALAVALPRIAASDAVRARLTEAVEDATRRTFGYASLSAGLLPPHLELQGATLGGDQAGPAASARSVELRLAVLPLLARAVVVRSLVVTEGTIRVERDAAGLHLAGQDLPEPPPRPHRPDDGEEEDDDELSLAVQRLVVRGSALRFVDRTREPAPELELQDVEGEATGRAADVPIEAELGGRLATGGRLTLRGSGRAGGPFEAKLELSGVELDPFAPYLGADPELRARADGVVTAAGAALPPERAAFDVRVAADPLAIGDLVARGPLALRAELAGDGAGGLSGPVELDATAAELSNRRAFRKAAGVAATAKATLHRERGEERRALRLDGLELVVGALRATGAAELEPRTALRLDAPPFDAAALGALVPALERRRPAGTLALDGLAVELDPLAVRGRLVLDPLGLGGLDAEHLVLRGALEGLGGEIEGRGLLAAVAGQEAPVTLHLRDLAGAPRLELATRLQGADSSALVAALGGDRDLLAGPLDLDAALAAPLGGERPPLAALAGDVSVRIAPGRLRRVSLLREAFEEARIVRPRDGAGERAYGDEFESLSGRFRIRDGEARTDDLRLEYGDYTAELRGSVGLADRALDLRGTLLVDEELAQSGRRTIPLASVTGTLDDPRVALSQEALAGLAAAYTGDERRREKWERKLDERLGEGRGKGVLEALDQVLESLQKAPPATGAGPPE
jgi:hypothetical protein